MTTATVDRDLKPRERGEPWRLQPGEQFRYAGQWMTVIKENQKHTDEGKVYVFAKDGDGAERTFLVELHARTWVRRFVPLKPKVSRDKSTEVTSPDDWV